MGKLQSKPRAASLLPTPSASIEELARQQGVTPALDLAEIGALWPADDKPDEFLDFVLRERRKRIEKGEAR